MPWQLILHFIKLNGRLSWLFEGRFFLLRMRLPSPNLMFRQMELGRTSHTKVRIVWLKNVAKPQIIEEICSRLDRIDIDIVHSISVLTELTEDNPLSIWPQYKLTERVDVTVANMAEGRVAILCDNFSHENFTNLRFFSFFDIVFPVTDFPSFGCRRN